MNNEDLEVYSLKFNSLVEWEEKDFKTYAEAFRKNLLHKLHSEGVHEQSSISITILQDYAKAWKKAGFTWGQFKTHLAAVSSLNRVVYRRDWISSLESIFTGKSVKRIPKVKSCITRNTDKAIWLLLPKFSTANEKDEINRKRWNKFIQEKAKNNIQGATYQNFKSLSYVNIVHNLSIKNKILEFLEQMEVTRETFKNVIKYDTPFSNKVCELFPEDLNDECEDISEALEEAEAEMDRLAQEKQVAETVATDIVKTAGLQEKLETPTKGELEIINEAMELGRKFSNIEKLAVNGVLDRYSEIKENYLSIFNLMKKLGY